jgi:outer membrane lipoprotein-sorting protein
MVSFRPHLATLILLLGGTVAHRVDAAAPAALVEDWLNHQSTIHTWSAEVVQTRTLKSLIQPLTATGRVWFAAPNQFRWELGDPPRTIAVRQPQRMLVIYPLLKRVEQYPLESGQAGPWRDALALLEAGFPQSRSELDARFLLRDAATTNGVHFLQLEPRSASARRFMPLIVVGIDQSTYALRSTEIRFADGSFMRNEFVRPQINPTLPDRAFEPALEPDWEWIQPGKP